MNYEILIISNNPENLEKLLLTTPEDVKINVVVNDDKKYPEKPNVKYHTSKLKTLGELRTYGFTCTDKEWLLLIDDDVLLTPEYRQWLKKPKIMKNRVYTPRIIGIGNNKFIEEQKELTKLKIKTPFYTPLTCLLIHRQNLTPLPPWDTAEDLYLNQYLIKQGVEFIQSPPVIHHGKQTIKRKIKHLEGGLRCLMYTKSWKYTGTSKGKRSLLTIPVIIDYIFKDLILIPFKTLKYWLPTTNTFKFSIYQALGKVDDVERWMYNTVQDGTLKVYEIGAGVGDTTKKQCSKGVHIEPNKSLHYLLRLNHKNCKIKSKPFGFGKINIEHDEYTLSRGENKVLTSQKLSGDILVSDCEGGEWQLVNYDLSRFKHIIIELHGDQKAVEEHILKTHDLKLTHHINKEVKVCHYKKAT